MLVCSVELNCLRCCLVRSDMAAENLHCQLTNNRVVQSQRLLRKICPSCRAPAVIPPEVLLRCKLSKSELDRIAPFRGKGCIKCNMTGYFGRTGASEVMLVDPDIRELVIQKKPSNVIHQLAVEKGMETLFQNALGLFKSGVTTLEEVLRVTSEE